MLLFRNNAIYAFVLSIPFMCLGIYKMKKISNISWKRYLECAVLVLALYIGGGCLLMEVMDANYGSTKEFLSVPLQQMARVRVKAEEMLSAEMQEKVEQFVQLEVAKDYSPHNADAVKFCVEFRGSLLDFIKIWLQLGINNPQIYVDAFLDSSIGYWYIEDQTHSQIYGVGSENGSGYLLTYTRAMPAGIGEMELSYLPKLRACMERIISDNAYQKIPVVRAVFTPAFYWWMLCMCIAVVVYRRRYNLLLPMIFLVIYYMTLLLSPTVLIRYMYPFVVTVPALGCCLERELLTNKETLGEKN